MNICIYFYQDRWWWLVRVSDLAIQTVHGSFVSYEEARSDADKFKNPLEI